MGRGRRRLPHPFRGGRSLSLRYLLCISIQLVLAEGPGANAVHPGGLPLHWRVLGGLRPPAPFPGKDETEFHVSLKGLRFPASALRTGALGRPWIDGVDLPSTLSVEAPSGAGSSERQCSWVPDSGSHWTKPRSGESRASREFVRGRWARIPKHLPVANRSAGVIPAAPVAPRANSLY
ncbi:hypothetical protein HJG60_010069 [Phyllostomus discolor]|uniref:Uncharacterized protein n=1 Tax=Phyllostomus discolor TaxID=89673 RepID=A0A834AZ68_9CHIR|nr:hypothetical protein HJG60_010069 [Phyllostomus discolor]